MNSLSRTVVDYLLKRYPSKSWPYNGVTTQVNCFTDLANRTRLKHGLGYLEDFILSSPPDSLCDLGCNTGLFPLWILAQTGHHIKKGLYVDANIYMTQACRANLKDNFFDMDNNKVVTGLVGEEEETPFYIKASHQSSNCFDGQGFKDYPPAISLEEEWGEVDGDMLKVDIEGSEYNFVDWNWDFVTNFKKVIIKYHEPLCDVSRIRSVMPNVFKLKYVTGLTCGNTYWEQR